MGAITGADALIIGAPTWHTGADEQRSGTSWDDWLYDTLPNLDVDGKKVAIFGMGDQQSYGYDHVESKAIRDDKFVGLMMDEDNQYDMSEDRVTAWVAQLKDEGFM